tara:strand:- start:439811 stop:440110 length:300 start_codon:yes stop_codon:yes gene_type:complete
MARDDVEVEVRNFLARFRSMIRVDMNTSGTYSISHCWGNETYGLHDVCQGFRITIKNILTGLLGYNEGVSFGVRSSVEKSERVLIFIHNVCRKLPVYDF